MRAWGVGRGGKCVIQDTRDIETMGGGKIERANERESENQRASESGRASRSGRARKRK